MGSMALSRGEPNRLLFGTDTYGNLCGQTNSDVSEGGEWRDMTGKNELFFGNPLSPDALQVCVGGCPSALATTNPAALVRDDVVCKANTTSDSAAGLSLAQVTFSRLCFDDCLCYPRYPSFELLNRCLPGPDMNATLSKIVDSEAGETAREMLGDVIEARFVILACAGIALFLSFVWLVLLRLCGGFMVWTMIILVLVATIAATILAAVYGGNAKDTYDERKEEGTETTRLMANYIILYALAAVGGLLIFVALLGLCFMRTEINRAIEIVKEAARTIGHIPSLIFFPIIIFLVMAAILVYWVYVMIYLATAGDPVYTSIGLEPNEPPRFVEYKADNTLRQLQAYHVFGGLWTINFLLAFNEMVIAGAVSHHYFREGREGTWKFPLVSAVWQTIRYHLGTLAFGSLIIAIVQFIRLVLIFIQKRLEAANNRVADFIFACLQYAFLCLERFLRFISRNAYIVTALDGDSFCAAARTAFNLLISNALSLMAITFVSNFLIILGKIVIILITAIIAAIWLRSMEELQIWVIPLILIIIIAYAICSLFATVFEMTIDATFLAYCIDVSRYDGTYAPQGLREFTNAHGGPRGKKKRRRGSGSYSRSRSRSRSRSGVSREHSPRSAYQ